MIPGFERARLVLHTNAGNQAIIQDLYVVFIRTGSPYRDPRSMGSAQ